MKAHKRFNMNAVVALSDEQKRWAAYAKPFNDKIINKYKTKPVRGTTNVQ